MEHTGQDDIDPKDYRWQSEYEKTWEHIQENEEGLIQPSVEEIVHQAKRRKLLEKKNVRLGMTRHVYVVIDFSECMSKQDLKPTRHFCSLKILEDFIEEFFDQNPISQLGILITRNKKAEKITELSGNVRIHKEALVKLKTYTCEGEPSLQNSMDLASQTLKHLPSHTSREVIFLYGSLTTCDPGDINLVIKEMRDANIRCSIIGLSAEMFVCKKISTETNGTYDVVLNDCHFKDILHQKLSPPIALTNQESSLIRMGFPSYQADGPPSMCYCHLDPQKPGEGFSTDGFYCPNCKAKYCRLPVECKICNLNLVSGANLARSYHHLFPLDNYEEVSLANLWDTDPKHCFSCQTIFVDQKVYRCEKCQKVFCLDCDLFIHDSLHTCPGCTCIPNQQS